MARWLLGFTRAARPLWIDLSTQRETVTLAADISQGSMAVRKITHMSAWWRTTNCCEKFAAHWVLLIAMKHWWLGLSLCARLKIVMWHLATGWQLQWVPTKLVHLITGQNGLGSCVGRNIAVIQVLHQLRLTVPWRKYWYMLRYDVFRVYRCLASGQVAPLHCRNQRPLWHKLSVSRRWKCDFFFPLASFALRSEYTQLTHFILVTCLEFLPAWEIASFFIASSNAFNHSKCSHEWFERTMGDQPAIAHAPDVILMHYFTVHSFGFSSPSFMQLL